MTVFNVPGFAIYRDQDDVGDDVSALRSYTILAHISFCLSFPYVLFLFLTSSFILSFLHFFCFPHFSFIPPSLISYRQEATTAGPNFCPSFPIWQLLVPFPGLFLRLHAAKEE